MKTDKVLERMDLERRKAILIVSKNKIKDGIGIKTGRGTLVFNNRYIISKIEWDIMHQIEDINNQLEELAGLNQNKIERLYEV